MSNDQTSPGGRNPPVEHRFPAGWSGNPRGRPKGSKNVKTIVRKFALEKHKVKEGGKTLHLTTVELLLRILFSKAMDGNVQAARMVDRLCGQYTSIASEDVGYILLPEVFSEAEAIREGNIANKYARLRRANRGSDQAK
jgi:hypothetical protein